MSSSKTSAPTTTITQTTTDSNNTTQTVNRTFDNVGNTQLYINSNPPSAVAASMDSNKMLIIAGVCVAGAVLLMKK